MSRRAVVVDVVRSPFARGRESGALHGTHPVDLLAEVLDALISRTGVDPALVEDVIAGCALPVGEQSGNIARHAALPACPSPCPASPSTVSAAQPNRRCTSRRTGSSLTAAMS